MTVATKVQKQVHIIARVEIKKSDLVVYKVRSSNGTDTYQTTFYNGKASGCSCPSYKPCYHMTQLQAREDERKQQEQPARLTREAYNDEFSPNTIPGMY